MSSTQIALFSELSLNRLRLPVKLGCEPEERVDTQYVHFDICFRFSKLPVGCKTDEVSDTICYSEVFQLVQKLCVGQEFKLIEKLGWDVFSAVKKFVPSDVKIWIRITKEKPPIPALKDGASFSVGDWQQQQV